MYILFYILYFQYTFPVPEIGHLTRIRVDFCFIPMGICLIPTSVRVPDLGPF